MPEPALIVFVCTMMIGFVLDARRVTNQNADKKLTPDEQRRIADWNWIMGPKPSLTTEPCADWLNGVSVDFPNSEKVKNAIHTFILMEDVDDHDLDAEIENAATESNGLDLLYSSIDTLGASVRQLEYRRELFGTLPDSELEAAKKRYDRAIEREAELWKAPRSAPKVKGPADHAQAERRVEYLEIMGSRKKVPIYTDDVTPVDYVEAESAY